MAEARSTGFDEKDAAALEKVNRDAGLHEGHVPETVLKHSHDEDEAMKAFAEAEGVSLEIDDATNKRLLQKIDWNLIPVSYNASEYQTPSDNMTDRRQIMCLVYGLNYLDKTTISYANVMGLQEDLGLVGDQYSWLGSMFYFGYLAWEYA